MFVNLAPAKSHGLGGACCASCAEHGGSCGGGGMGRGVQEYLPVSWQRELAAYSLGGPIRPPRSGLGLFDSLDTSTWGTTEWLVLAAAGGVLLWLVSGADETRARVEYEKKVMASGGWGAHWGEPKRKRKRRKKQ